VSFSALQRAEIAEIRTAISPNCANWRLSVLFNEPKLLKFLKAHCFGFKQSPFSALQRAEIAEIFKTLRSSTVPSQTFSALQRAEIAEIFASSSPRMITPSSFSALQRAEIAEIRTRRSSSRAPSDFQCSSTSRNC